MPILPTTSCCAASQSSNSKSSIAATCHTPYYQCIAANTIIAGVFCCLHVYNGVHPPYLLVPTTQAADVVAAASFEEKQGSPVEYAVYRARVAMLMLLRNPTRWHATFGAVLNNVRMRWCTYLVSNKH